MLLADQPSASVPKGRAEIPPIRAISSDSKKEGNQNLPPRITQKPQHAYVVDPLADGGEHGVHHAENAAHGHDHGNERHGVQELQIGIAQAGIVFGFDLCLQMRLFIAAFELIIGIDVVDKIVESFGLFVPGRCER